MQDLSQLTYALGSADYCLALPEDDNQAEQCWEAYEYFEERKVSACAPCLPRHVCSEALCLGQGSRLPLG